MTRTLLALLLALNLMSCAKMLNNLRRDLDDSEPYTEPTVGGRWTERGFLSDNMPESGDRYSAVGHSERNPASLGSGNDVAQNGWVTPEQIAANRRDLYRGQADEGNGEAMPPSYSDSPEVSPPVKRQYRNGNRATRNDFLDNAPGEGSLWASDGQTNYYFTKNKVRGIGDIVTITIEPDLYKDMVTEARRTLSPREKDGELALAQERIRRRTLGLPPLPGDEDKDPKKKDALASTAAAPARGPAAAADDTQAAAKVKNEDEVEIPKATPADIDVAKTLGVKAGDTMMAEIVERFPNGNYKIRGVKKVPYRNGSPRLMNVTAIVRGNDITEEDTVSSGKFYEYRLESLRQN